MSANERFSLKDHLFNEKKVKRVSGEIYDVYLDFQSDDFEREVLSKFPELELMERLYWMRECLCKYLPSDYRQAVKILLESLPPHCDPTLEDDDFGDFIYGPYGNFVSEYGCTRREAKFSLKALRDMTMRFSVEFPIRAFINKFPEETLVAMSSWVNDRHYHVRRLVSEGTRPLLPWAKKITLDYKTPLQFLDILHADQTRFVTRSVANHLNDISKIDADLVVETLKKWRKEGKQEEKEMDFITTHSLRTLVKKGNIKALRLLGYSSNEIKVRKLSIKTPKVNFGDSVEFSFEIMSTSAKSQELMIDCIVHFNKANGGLSPKTHKIAKKTIRSGEKLVIEKKHPLRVMTTKKLYPGLHKIELQINGQKFTGGDFYLLK